MSRSKISEKRSARGRGGAVSGRCELRWRRLRDPASLEQSVQAPGRSHESDCIVWWSAVHSRNRAGGLWRPRAAASPRVRGLGARGQRVLSAGCVQGHAATRARKPFYPRIRRRGRAEIAAAEPIWLRAARRGIPGISGLGRGRTDGDCGKGERVDHEEDRVHCGESRVGGGVDVLPRLPASAALLAWRSHISRNVERARA
jgi:hypothetical protein